MKSPPRITSQAAAARHLDVPRSTFREWLRDPGFPEKGPEGWNPAALIAYRDQRREKLEQPEPGDGADYYQERALKMKASREIAELELARKRDETVLVSEVRKSWGEVIALQRDTVQKGFHSLAPKLSGLDAPAILIELNKFWRQVQKQLSDAYATNAKP